MPPVPPQAAALSAPSRREYAAMLLPFILSTVTQPLIGAVDTAVMGRLSDPSYIAGVAVGAVIFNTLYWLLGFLRVGSTGFSAQALATGDAEAAWKAFLLPGIMALLLGTFILLCRDAVYLTSKDQGCWYPEVTPGAPVSRGTVLGTVRDIFGRAIDCYRAEKDGIILYMTVSLAVKAGTPLVAYG